MTTEMTMEKQTETNEVEHARSGYFYRPNVDIVELPDELVLKADMPGTSGEKIDIHFEDGALTIRGTIAARQPADVRYVRQEFGVGDFYRTFRLSEQIDPSRIVAEYSEGVLTLHLPKAESVKPRKIAVKC